MKQTNQGQKRKEPDMPGTKKRQKQNQPAGLLKAARSCIALGPAAFDSWPALIKTHLNLSGHDKSPHQAMQDVAQFYLTHQKDESLDGQVVVRCGSNYAVTTHRTLRQHGQDIDCWVDPADEQHDFLSALSDQCKYLVDLTPAPESANVAKCIIKSLYNSWTRFFKEYVQLTDNERIQLLEAADCFALNPLRRYIIQKEVLIPLWRMQQRAGDILDRFKNHPLVLRQIVKTLETQINETAGEEAAIMKIFQTNAITLVLTNIYFASRDNLQSATAENCFIIINWSIELQQYPQWLDAIKPHVAPTTVYTCIGIEEDDYLFELGAVDLCGWSLQDDGFKRAHMMHLESADDLHGMIDQTLGLLEDEEEWMQDCKEEWRARKNYVDMIMSVQDSTSAKRVFTSTKLKHMEDSVFISLDRLHVSVQNEFQYRKEWQPVPVCQDESTSDEDW